MMICGGRRGGSDRFDGSRVPIATWVAGTIVCAGCRRQSGDCGLLLVLAPCRGERSQFAVISRQLDYRRPKLDHVRKSAVRTRTARSSIATPKGSLTRCGRTARLPQTPQQFAYHRSNGVKEQAVLEVGRRGIRIPGRVAGRGRLMLQRQPEGKRV